MREADLATLLDRHARLWRRESAERPLMHIVPFVSLHENPDAPLLGGGFAHEGDEILPDQLDLDRMLEIWPVPRDLARADTPDFLREAYPYGLCWLEGITGATVRAASGSIWAEPNDRFDLADGKRLRERLSPDNPWYARLCEYLTRLGKESKGQAPVAHTLMRGPIDILEALMGTEPLSLAFYDRPKELAEALDAATDVFIAVGKLLTELTPPFRGGWSVFGIWAPGSVIRMQADHAALISPRLYREWIYPLDQRMASAFDHTSYHLHSGNLHVLDSLLDTPSLDFIQVTLDPWPFAPRLQDLLPRLKDVQAAGKILFLSGGPVSQEELDKTLEVLPPTGLALQLGIGSTWD